MENNHGDYLSLPDAEDWAFGKKDFTIEGEIKYHKSLLLWMKLVSFYRRYILYPRWRIFKSLKLCKISYGEYLDILSFRNNIVKDFLFKYWRKLVIVCLQIYFNEREK